MDKLELRRKSKGPSTWRYDNTGWLAGHCLAAALHPARAEFSKSANLRRMHCIVCPRIYIGSPPGVRSPFCVHARSPARPPAENPFAPSPTLPSAVQYEPIACESGTEMPNLHFILVVSHRRYTIAHPKQSSSRGLWGICIVIIMLPRTFGVAHHRQLNCNPFGIRCVPYLLSCFVALHIRGRHTNLFQLLYHFRGCLRHTM